MLTRLYTLFLLFVTFQAHGEVCTLAVEISTTGTAICSGSTVTLTAKTTGGIGPFSYAWSTGETTSAINVNKAGTYSVSVSDKTPGCQPVTKNITIIVSPTPSPPSARSQIVCQNAMATLTATAPCGNYQWYDAPTGGTFLGSGNTYTTPAIASSTTFYVQTTVSDCTSPRTAVPVYVVGKPTVTGATVCSGSVATLSASGGNDYTWYDAPAGGVKVGTGATFTTPPLLKTTTYYLESISNGCSSGRLPVIAQVGTPPQMPEVTGATICTGSVASLHADAPAGVLNWFDTPSGGTPLITSPDFTTPVLTATTTYYVQTSLNDCESARTPVKVTVNPIPNAPAPQTVSVCSGTSATLNASTSTSTNYQWYDAPEEGHLLTTGLTYKTPVLTHSTTYYVLSTSAGCSSDRSPIAVVISPPPTAPSVSGSVICTGSVTTLSATAATGSIEWYNEATGGKLLTTGATYTTPSLTTSTTYYVQTVQSGCISSRTAVTVTVLAPATAPTVSPVTICAGDRTSLNAIGTDSHFAWYDSANGGKLLSTAQTYVTPALSATTTYYVQTINGDDCESSRTPVIVTVNQPPPAPSISGASSVCSGSPANLTATAAPGATLSWYDEASGGQLLGAGTTFNTPNLSQTTTYYVQNSIGTCSSSRTPITVTVNSADDIGFLYPSGTYGTVGPNPKPAIRNSPGGTFTSVPAGLSINSSTGEINLSTSNPGTYIVTLTSNGPCGGTYSAGVTITSHPNAEFFYDGPYCQGGLNPLPSLISSDASVGVFSVQPAGLVFKSTSTGEIDLSASAPGTYKITNTITIGNSKPISYTAEVQIDQRVTVDAGTDQTVAADSPVSLTGSIKGVRGGTWAGGTGSFTNRNQATTTYKPAPGEQVAVLKLTSNDPNNACGPKSDEVIIHFQPVPAAPTAPGASVCMGSSTIISAIAPGGIYTWYDAPTGGTLLYTGPNFPTPPLTQTTTYYVQTKVGQLVSPRTAVEVKVIPPLPAPIAPSASICIGQFATLTASGTPGGEYQWFDAPVGGNRLSLKETYVTTTLTTNTSYYVQVTVQGCTSPRTKVDVQVNPVPGITSLSTGVICSGNALNYTITADLATATFSWSRALLPGISNSAVSDQHTPITETLINTTGSPIDVTYLIVPFAGGCPGATFSYVVTVYPTPVITSAAPGSICNMTSSNYHVTFSVPGTSFSWSRAAVPGISNTSISGQAASTIHEILFNTTNAPIDVIYLFNYKTAKCSATPTPLIVTVNPTINITSNAKDPACSGVPQNYTIQSNVPLATFSWRRAAVANISNPAVDDHSASIIGEALVNTGISPVNVTYKITPTAYGCQGNPFNYVVTVNPQPSIPAAKSNTPVCAGNTILLNTDFVQNATYLWTGPNAYSSTLRNPAIKNVTTAHSGTYKIYVTVNGCTSPAGSTLVLVNEPPIVNAGHDTLVCTTTTTIQLNGDVHGGTSTGIWSSNGTGSFSPANNNLKAAYIPSAQDKSKGAVTLTLASTSKDDCTIATSDMTITFGLSPAANAGADIEVCNQDVAVPLNGKLNAMVPAGSKWSSSGSGTFSPSANQLNASYIPSKEDIQNGSVTLTLLATGANTQCYTLTDDLKVKFTPPPTVNAGNVRYVLKDKTITLTPKVSDNNVQYLWSPNIDISDTKVKNPVITGDVDRTYILQVTDSRGCISQDQVIVKVSPELTVPNTFTPNGDGFNDFWEIKGLVAYQDAIIDIFNRYGTKLYHSVGYSTPWNGTYNGQALPPGTYYYIINTKVNSQVISGSVTILR